MKRLVAVVCVLAVICVAMPVLAGVIDFSTPGTYVLSTPSTYANGSTESASIINVGGEHGDVIRLSLSDAADGNVDWVGASVKCLGTYGTVNHMSADGITFETYIASASGISQDTPPYSYIGVDLNKNGVWDGSSAGDALIIPWDATGTAVYQQWFTNGYNGTSRVHVWQNGANRSFGGSISINMADLATNEYAAGQTWGDINVVSVYVGAGIITLVQVFPDTGRTRKTTIKSLKGALFSRGKLIFSE